MNSNSTPSILHIYTRVSTLVQADKGTSLQSQLELGKEKATELGFNYQHWDEGGKSSHHDDIAGRPVLFELYNAIRDGQVKHLWVYDQSRLSRNDQVASVLRYECNKQGVTLYTKDGQFDLSSPQDKFLKQLLDAVAELDNVTRAERTRLGKLNSETPCQRGTGCGFSRSMNIYRADELVWNLVTDLHRKSSVLREEVKRRSLKQHGLEQAADEKQTKKLAARVRKLQQDVIAVSETIGNLEANRLMKRMDEISYKTLVSRLSEEKDRLNEQLNAARLELQGGVEKKRFVDWFKNFGKEVEKTSQFNDEERKQYVEGLIERIDVKWLEDTREHELVLHFRLPIVNDRIEWRDPKKKSLGYDLHEGENQAILSISKKDGRG